MLQRYPTLILVSSVFFPSHSGGSVWSNTTGAMATPFLSKITD
jgi:hypothetical protein